MIEHAVRNKASQMGLDVVWSNPRLLLLDLDSEEDFKRARATILCMKDVFVKFSKVTYTRSKSNNWHIYVHLDEDKSPSERYLLQFAMGSDKVKEIVQVQELETYGLDLCVLFERPGAVHHTII